ncbi:MAG: efflux RND transporter permease subunit, partial [Myxococcota bacterium]
MEPLLPERWRTLPGWVENVVAVVAVLLLLVGEWLPLGPGAGFGHNLVFVVTIIGTLMTFFLVFLTFYDRLLQWALEYKHLFLMLPVALVLMGTVSWLGFDAVFGWLPKSVRLNTTVARVAHAFPGFGREFMPPFDEGSYLYMPTTMPHASLGEALELLQQMDASIKMIPEVEEVVGKIGRVESPLDPAPVSMIETLITYKPEYRTGPHGAQVRQWRKHIRTPRDIWTEITRAASLPGLTSAPELMPINTRIVMLQTGMRAPMGLKVRGPDLDTIETVGLRLEELLRQVPSIRPETVFAERIVGKPYLEIDLDREAIGRYGLAIEDVQQVIQVGIGGITLTRTVEGRERYPVRVRYMREERDSVEALYTIVIPTPGGEQIPLESVASIRYVRGPQVIRSEDTSLTGYVIFARQPDFAETDVVEQAQAFLQEKLARGEFVLPAGTSYAFTGSYENQVRSEQRLTLLLPLALALIVVLLYLQFQRVETTLIIYTGVAVAVSGGFILIWLYNQSWFMDFDWMGTSMRELFQIGPTHMSVAVWVGFIALIGIATDDGVVMATYLKQRFEQAPTDTIEAIRQRVREAGGRRVRPCLMTTATTLLALLPVVTSQGRGADVMVPMAIPSLGGMAIELVTLFVVPVLYCASEEVRWHVAQFKARHAVEASTPREGTPSGT